MKPSKNKILILILTFAGLLPIALYFYKFHDGLAEIHSRWAEFGSFFSPVIGLLAFAGVLYSIELTKKQFRRQSEESGFFSLLNIYIKNIDQISLYNNEYSGDVFKRLIDEYYKLFKKRCFYFAHHAIINDLENVHEFGYRFLFDKITRKKCFHAGEEEKKIVVNYFENRKEDKDEALKMLVDGRCSDEDRDRMEDIGALYFEDSSPAYRIEKMSLIYEDFDDKFGYQTTKYFNHIYCFLDYIDRTEEADKYINIFKSQLSRNEIVLLYYNMMNQDTEKNFNKLVFKHRLLDNIYSPAICYTAHDVRLGKDMEEIKRSLS